MKASRRHELKENDLAHLIEVSRTYLSEHGTKCGVIVVATVALVVAVSAAVSSRAGTVEQLWTAKNKLLFQDLGEGRKSLEKLSSLADESTDDNFVLNALFEQGMHALRLAQEVDVPPDPELNNHARRAFETLVTRFATNPLAFGTGHYGLATVEENDFALDSDQDHKERAQEHLQKILDNPSLSSMPYHQMASDRLKKLDSVFTIVRFASPKPPDEPDELNELNEQPKIIEITPTLVPLDEVPEHLRSLQAPSPTEQGENSDNTP